MQNRTGGNGGNGVFERTTGKMLDDCMYHRSVSGDYAGSSPLFSLFSPVLNRACYGRCKRACWLWHSPSLILVPPKKHRVIRKNLLWNSQRREPVAPIHLAASGDIAAYDRHFAC